ncbi:MAG: hypothetical protein AB8B73_06595 [Ekhidna sp.]
MEIKSDYYVFELRIQNASSKPLYINTAQIRKHAHHLSFIDNKKKISQEVLPSMSAIQINQFFESKRRKAKAAGVFLFLLGAAISSYDGIRDDQDNSKKYWNKRDESKSMLREVVSSTSIISTNLFADASFAAEEKAELELRHLPKELFNKEIIYPGENYYGKVLFRKIELTQEYHRIIYPFEDGNLSFDFRRANSKERKFLTNR